MKLPRLLWLVVVATAGCGDPNACTPGMSVACACPDGRTGAQVCADDGTFEACRCESGPADAGPPPVDAGSTDAGRLDSGTALDASLDAGRADSGSATDDSGTVSVDAGPPGDAGTARYTLRIPTDEARALVSDATTGDLYPATFTIELWVKFDRFLPGLLQYLLTSGSNLYLRVTDTDTFECVARGSLRTVADVRDASTVFGTGVWHHVACTYDSSSRLTLWIDGSPVMSETGSYTPPVGSTLAIGGDSSPTPSVSNRFQGEIDEVRISNALMYFGAFTPSRRLNVQPSTVALWHFDEGSGSIARDEVGPDRHPAVLDMGATWAPE